MTPAPSTSRPAAALDVVDRLGRPAELSGWRRLLRLWSVPARLVVGLGPLALLGGLAVGACAQEASDSSQLSLNETTTENHGGALDEHDPVETALGAGLAADLDPQAEVRPFAEPEDETPSTGPEAGCSSLRATVDIGTTQVELWLNATGCAGRPSNQIGNGFHGRYVTIDDVPEPSDIEDHQTPAGALALDTPPDPDRPALMLLSPRGEVPADDLVTLANAVHPA